MRQLSNKMVEFKKMEVHEWVKVQSIAYETWPDAYGRVLPKEQLEYKLLLIYNEDSLKKQMIEKGHCFLLSDKQMHSLGFASYEINYNTVPQLMIHKFYILPVS